MKKYNSLQIEIVTMQEDVVRTSEIIRLEDIFTDESFSEF